MLLMHANNREDIKEAYAGDIVALAGLKEVRTGDTLCDPQKPVILEKMEFPDPVIEIAIEPKSKADQEKLGVALAKLVAEDPSFRVSHRSGVAARPSSRGWANCISTSRSTSSSAPTRSKPISARRRSPIARRSPSTVDHRLHPQEADRRLRPVRARQDRASSRCAPGTGFVFENEVVGGAVPKEYIPGVEKGLEVGARLRRARRLPGGRSQGDADRRRLPRRRLLGAGLRNRLARGVARRRCRRAARCCSSRS